MTQGEMSELDGSASGSASGPASSSTPEPPAVTPKLGPSGKPIRRRGRWTFVSHPQNGDVWRLDGTTLDLEHDPGCHACCVGGRCNGAWILSEDGRYKEPVDEYLDGAMSWVEQEHGPAAVTAANGGRAG